jgi:hypothetical protein
MEKILSLLKTTERRDELSFFAGGAKAFQTVAINWSGKEPPLTNRREKMGLISKSTTVQYPDPLCLESH